MIETTVKSTIKTQVTDEPQSEEITLGQIVALHSQATEILQEIIQAHDGEIPYDCAANVVLECYRRLNVPKDAVIQQGQFNAWTEQSGLSHRKNHVWLKANDYTIIDPLAELFRDNRVPVEPISYEVKRELTVEELQTLDSYCEDF